MTDGSMTPDLGQDGARILIVDDDEDLRHELASYLSAQGFSIHQAGNAREARQLLEHQPVEVVVLDVFLPGEDGLSLCRYLAGGRGRRILMHSAAGEMVDRVLGLELGADDYIVKPAAPRELLARLRALLRRRGQVQPYPTGAYVFAGFRLDLERRQLRGPNGGSVELTRGELALLNAFVKNARRPLSREELLKLSRGEDSSELYRAVDIQISRLRRKLYEQSGVVLIKTLRGQGYSLDCQVTRN
jgi:two-component system, OmpR family, response regulator